MEVAGQQVMLHTLTCSSPRHVYSFTVPSCLLQSPVPDFQAETACTTLIFTVNHIKRLSWLSGGVQHALQ